MQTEGASIVQRYNSDTLLEKTFRIRRYLDKDLREFDSAIEERESAETLLEDSQEIVEFLADVHRVINIQNVSLVPGTKKNFPGEDKDIKQELYSLFDRASMRASKQQKDWQIMTQLIKLACPDCDSETQRKWAQTEFVERGIWSDKNKGAEWKKLLKYQKGNSKRSYAIVPLGNETEDKATYYSVKEQIDIFWSWLEAKRRVDRKLRDERTSRGM